MAKLSRETVAKFINSQKFLPKYTLSEQEIKESIINTIGNTAESFEDIAEVYGVYFDGIRLDQGDLNASKLSDKEITYQREMESINNQRAELSRQPRSIQNERRMKYLKMEEDKLKRASR